MARSMSATSRRTYLARETAISGVINGVLSLGFFMVLFRDLDPVPVWGARSFVFDFAPQSFAIGLMATLVPGLLAVRAGNDVARVDVSLVAGFDRVAVVRHALGHAVLAAAAGTAVFAGAFEMVGAETVGRTAAVALKVAYGVLLGATVTRLTVGRMLAR
jgi:hypothetical protein